MSKDHGIRHSINWKRSEYKDIHAQFLSIYNDAEFILDCIASQAAKERAEIISLQALAGIEMICRLNESD